jgi:hypothetical protein
MNKPQRVVVILGVVALVYLLAQFYFFYTCPIGVMCSANKQELTTRMIIVIAATAVAAWLLKSDARPDAPDPTQPDQPGVGAEPVEPASPAETPVDTNADLPKEE